MSPSYCYRGIIYDISNDLTKSHMRASTNVSSIFKANIFILAINRLFTANSTLHCYIDSEFETDQEYIFYKLREASFWVLPRSFT